jgi:trk system potassium uptake protein TrkA
MKPGKRHICVIGMGHFGRGLARALARRCEVLAIDREIDRINRIANDVQRALCLDARDEKALAAAITHEFDEAVVCIGESIEASILCALHLKRLGVKSIRAKAITDDHADILRALGVSEVIFPEQETAERRALQILEPNLLDFIPLAEDYRVMQVAARPEMAGSTLAALQLRARFGVFVLAVKRSGGAAFLFLPGPGEVIQTDDALVVIGREDDILRMQQEGGAPTPPAE